MAELYFIDTNLFLRYLTNDIPQQADRVEALFQRAIRGEIRLVTSLLVFAEIVWVMSSFYKLSREQVKDCLLAILNTEGLEIPESDLLLQATLDFAAKNVDFIDAYNASWAKHRGTAGVYTFDSRHFSRFTELKILEP